MERLPIFFWVALALHLTVHKLGMLEIACFVDCDFESTRYSTVSERLEFELAWAHQLNFSLNVIAKLFVASAPTVLYFHNVGGLAIFYLRCLGLCFLFAFTRSHF